MVPAVLQHDRCHKEQCSQPPSKAEDKVIIVVNCQVSWDLLFTVLGQRMDYLMEVSRHVQRKRMSAGVKGEMDKEWEYYEASLFSYSRCITRAMNDPDEPLNSVSKIDKISRKVLILINESKYPNTFFTE